MNHTPEPWAIGDPLLGSTLVEIHGADGSLVACLYESDAARIVACVNACADKDSDEMRRQAEAVPKLLAACKDFMGTIDIYGRTCDSCGRVYDPVPMDCLCTSDNCPAFRARAAIAEAEGKGE